MSTWRLAVLYRKDQISLAVVAQGITYGRNGLCCQGYDVAYDKEGIDPCKCGAVSCTAAHYCERVPVTLFRTGINDDNAQVVVCAQRPASRLRGVARRTGSTRADRALLA
jgi:hypothetical protein